MDRETAKAKSRREAIALAHKYNARLAVERPGAGFQWFVDANDGLYLDYVRDRQDW